jgi:hypothetical protein
MALQFFRGSRALDALLSKRTWRLEPRFLGDLKGVEGVIPFRTRDNLTGNFLVDRSLSFPIQVREVFEPSLLRQPQVHPAIFLIISDMRIWLTPLYVLQSGDQLHNKAPNNDR